MRSAILKTTMLALLSITPLPAFAQDTAPAELTSAYEQYAAARMSFTQIQAQGGDTAPQADAVQAARENLANICASFDAPEISACLDQFIAPELRIPGDLEPLAVQIEAPAQPVPEVEVIAPEVPAIVEAPVEVIAPAAPIEAAPVPAPAPAPEPAPEVIIEAQPVEPAQPVIVAPAAQEPAATPEQTPQTLDPTVAVEPIEPSAENAPKPEEIAPLLDSAKDETSAPAEQQPAQAPATEQTQAPAAEQTNVTAEPAPEPAPAAPPPQNDVEAQVTIAPAEMVSITAEEGERIAAPSRAETAAAQTTPQAATIIEQNKTDFRVVLQFNNQIIIQNQDNSRLEYDSSETYIERLNNGRIRETIERNDGTRIVTIYNRNGDIVQRSRFSANGEEYVLVYVDETYEDDLLEWRDPARDLAPLYLGIPVSEYILDADDANEEELMLFLDQPPVERVQRLYSINEVKRSARIRDMVRRLEVGNLTFPSGDASVPRDQVAGLTKVANAMYELLQKNPGETFLIEGHTDAVGSEIANLELSDRRAETVAIVLSQVFGIPPENLATQGYGERYLKIRTPDAERRNRRVTIKRITPLIAPVYQR